MSSINCENCVCNVDILMELHVTIGYEDLSVCTIDKTLHGENFTDTECRGIVATCVCRQQSFC